MDPAIQPVKKNNLNFVVIIVILLLACLLVAFALSNRHKQSNTPSEVSTVPGDWSMYEAKQYGFKVSYPKSWSSPKIQQTNNNGQPTSYQIALSDKKGYSVIAVLGKSPTATDIKNALAGNMKGFLKYDSSSYSTALTDPETKSFGQINLLQTLSLPKQGFSGVLVEVVLNPSKNCPDRLVSGQSATCFTEDDYKNVSLFAKNIKEL